MAIERAVISTPVGFVGLAAEAGALIAVTFGPPWVAPEPPGPAVAEAARQVEQYFAGRRTGFTVPLRRPAATPFQHRVWDAMLRIPAGETRTYGELAAELGTSPRAVGGACGRNALPLFIPCHRVVAKTGLGGFSGDWETGLALDVKQRLLEHEGALPRPAR